MKKAKDRRDLYYRKAKEEGYRARSAFKLKEILTSFPLKSTPQIIVDLCASPGSWSQILKEFYPHSTIIAIDLKKLVPLPGIINIQGDITSEKTYKAILEIIGTKKVDLIVCDGSPDVLNIPDFDEYIQHEIVFSGLELCKRLLGPCGRFICKVFRGKNVSYLFSVIVCCFERCIVSKPHTCRNRSVEGYIVCIGYKTNSEGSVEFVSCKGTGYGDCDMNYLEET